MGMKMWVNEWMDAKLKDSCKFEVSSPMPVLT